MTPDPPPASPDLRALAAGDVSAFTALYDRLSQPMLKLARTMSASPQDAEDAVHDVFVNLARGRHRLVEVRDLDAYVFGTLRNAILARANRQKCEARHLRRISSAVSSHAEPRNAPADDELTHHLAALPSAQREVILLKIDAGLTFEQIGEVLQLSPNTAASRYRYALEKLRQRLKETP